MADREWLSVPTSLWDRDAKRRTHRHGNSYWSSREPTQIEEEHAVHEALRESTVKLWREMYQRMTVAEARVAELEIENRRLRMNPPD